MVGTLAAYGQGTSWLEELLQRLDANRTLFGHLVTELLPGVRQRPLEATYLAWLDVRALGHEDPAGLALREGRVLVNDGARFGPGGQGHVRRQPGHLPRAAGADRPPARGGLGETAAAMSPAARRGPHRGGPPTAERHCP